MITTTEPDLIVKTSSICSVFRVDTVHTHTKQLEAVTNKVNSLVQDGLNLFSWVVEDTRITIFPCLDIVDWAWFCWVVCSIGDFIVTHSTRQITVHPSGAWACISCEKCLCKNDFYLAVAILGMRKVVSLNPTTAGRKKN